MSYVQINEGTYRNKPVHGTFKLVGQYKEGAKGGYITVANGGHFPGFPEQVRINVPNIRAYSFINDAALNGADVVAQDVAIESAPVLLRETDDEVMTRIGERFEILTDMTKAAIAGDIRAIIVTGPPGVGKSYGVERELDKAALFDQIAGRRVKSEMIKGSTTAIGLYQVLYKYSDKNSIVVFDDCDSVLLDDTCLNMLKGALDSGKKRKISWLGESNALRREGIPDSFNFNGSVIFITNLKFDKVKGSKLQEHLTALMSRCHYVDLTIDTMRDKVLRIKQIAKTGQLFDGYDFDQQAEDEVIAFLELNKDKMREVSLRTALKIADLRKSFPTKWMPMARTTVMRAA